VFKEIVLFLHQLSDACICAPSSLAKIRQRQQHLL